MEGDIVKGQAGRKRVVSFDLPPMKKTYQPKSTEGAGRSDWGDEQEGVWMEGLKVARRGEGGWWPRWPGRCWGG